VSSDVAATDMPPHKGIGSFLGLEQLTMGQRYTAGIAAVFVLALLTLGAPNAPGGSSAEAVAGGVPAAASGAGLVAQPQAATPAGTVSAIDAPVQPYLPDAYSTSTPTSTFEEPAPTEPTSPTSESPSSPPPSSPPTTPTTQPSPLQPVLDLLP
jgi:hypothetical protein